MTADPVPVPRHLSEEERALWEKMEAATPGPWTTCGGHFSDRATPDCGCYGRAYSLGQTHQQDTDIQIYSPPGTYEKRDHRTHDNAEFIAAANPAVIRSLLTALSTSRTDAALTIERLTDELTGATRLAVEARKQYDAVKVERDEARGALSSEREAGEQSIRELQAINAARSVRWMAGSPGWTILEIAGELAGEVGELANVCKKLRRSEMGVPGNKVSDEVLRDQARSEMADVFIVLMLTASKLDVDLYAAVCDTFNAKSEQMGFPERFGRAPSTETPR